MKINMKDIGAALLALGVCAICGDVRAQGTTTVTTSRGAFTEYVPGSQTVVIRSETNPAPLRYVVSKQTTIVDESGAPVAIERIPVGNPLSVQYTGAGDSLVASRIVVQHAPVSSAPVTTEHTSTTTTTTRTLTHDEKEALEERREDRKERAEEQIEKQKEALEKAKDKLEDDDDH